MRNNIYWLYIAVLSALFIPSTGMAQRQFTLEDLNFGGINYRKFVPENRYTTWWGDELIRLDAEECSIINKVSGKESVLFTLADANKWLDTSTTDKVHSLYRVSFPYADKPLVLLRTKNRMYLLNWKKHHAEWQMATHRQFKEILMI